MTYSKKLFDLANEVAIITGAAKGIGKAMAQGLASQGAIVVLTDIDEKSGLETLDEFQELGCRAVYKKVDITLSEDVDRLVEDVLDEYSRIDILVNNAGTVVRKPVLETTESDWDKVLNINLKGAFLMSRAVGPSMIKRRKGKIINVGSVSSYLGHPERAAYGASKGGILILTKVLAVEWGRYGINVNGIAPGYVKSPLTADLVLDDNKYRALVAKIPVGRLGETSDLIGPVIFLASRSSDYINGHMLLVDGGRTAD